MWPGFPSPYAAIAYARIHPRNVTWLVRLRRGQACEPPRR